MWTFAQRKCLRNKMEETFSQKLDFSEAYLQLQVEEKCSKLLAINNHKGLYKFSQPPLEMKVAPSIFPQVMDRILAYTRFAVTYLDDIFIKSEFRSQHEEHVKIDKGDSIQIQWVKSEIVMPEIKYFV